MIKAVQIQHNEITEKLFSICQNAGYEYVSLGFGSSKIFVEDDWYKEIHRLKLMLDKYKLSCVQTHAPYYDLRISSEITEPETEEAIKRCIEATAILGADVCALHPRSAFNFDFSRKRAFEDNRGAIKDYIPVAKKNNVVISLENLPVFPSQPSWKFYCWNYEDLIELADSFNSEYIGICWDFGHAHLSGADQVRGLECVGSRLSCTHIHDNYANDDHHNVPGMGTTEWNRIMPVLKKIGYKGPLTLEIDYRDNPTLETYIAHSLSCVKYVESLIELGE